MLGFLALQQRKKLTHGKIKTYHSFEKQDRDFKVNEEKVIFHMGW